MNRLDKLSNDDDALIFDELDILRGEMNELMDSNPILAHFGEQVLLHRMQRIRKVLKKAVEARKMAYKFLKQHRKTGTIRPIPFSAHLMEQEEWGSIGRFFKKVARKVKKVVKKVVKVVKKVAKTVVKVVGGLLKVYLYTKSRFVKIQ